MEKNLSRFFVCVWKWGGRESDKLNLNLYVKPGLCDTLEGRDWVVGGRDAQEGEDICIPMTDPC